MIPMSPNQGPQPNAHAPRPAMPQPPDHIGMRLPPTPEQMMEQKRLEELLQRLRQAQMG